MYTSLADIQKIIPTRTLAQLTDDEAGAEITTNVVDEAIVAADEVIDAHLRGRYTLPFPDNMPPPILRRLSADIAVFHLYGRRPERRVPEAISQKYKDSIRMLEGIRDGKISLGETDGEATPETDKFKTRRTEEKRYFGGRT